MLVGDGRGPKRAVGGAGLIASVDLDDVIAPNVVMVPGGGPLIGDQVRNDRFLDWLRRADKTSTWTTSVCTGALLLGAAGRRATTHWRARSALGPFGADYVDARWAQDGKYVTSAGVSAGIDMALALCELLAGPLIADAVQLSAHYDPAPSRPMMHWSVASPELLNLGVDPLRWTRVVVSQAARLAA